MPAARHEHSLKLPAEYDLTIIHRSEPSEPYNADNHCGIIRLANWLYLLWSRFCLTQIKREKRKEDGFYG